MEYLETPARQANSVTRERFHREPWIVGGLFLAATLPCLVFRYLPMTDLPQHEAIVSIMRHLRDPSYGFAQYYAWALDRTLYVFPYFLALALSYLVPVHWALHITVWAAALTYPLGLYLMLRAQRKPVWLSLVAVPLIYNRSFFWGFINFNFAMGFSFIALSLLIGNWSKRKGWAVAGLCLLSAVTHVYGLLMLAAYLLAWFICGERRALKDRALWIVPGFVALAGWALFAAKAPGYGTTEWVPYDVRLKELGNSILGGYVDRSEDVILVAFVLLSLAIVSRGLPFTWRRWSTLGAHAKASWLLLFGNIVAYFLLPAATPTAKFIHFRHAVIAALMLPAIVAVTEIPVLPKRLGVAVYALALLTIVNSWWHFGAFEAEARDFDEILSAIMPRPHLVQLTYESKGKILRSHAYLHFGAYAQARKGGVIAVSFPILFWNIPLKARENSRMPYTPKNLEWAPGRFNERRMGSFYDTVLVRKRPDSSGRNPSARYDLVTTKGPWNLYRKSALE